MISHAISSLENLGFSVYEAKAYIGLQQGSPVSGYLLSKKTGIPRSRIYDTLDRLVDKGVATKVYSDPIEYLPLSTDELLFEVKNNFNENLSSFEVAIEKLSKRASSGDILVIWGGEKIIDRARLMVSRATESIYLMGWSDIDLELMAGIEKAAQRGINIVTISKETLFNMKGHHSRHIFKDNDDQTDQSVIYLSVDGREVLIGQGEGVEDSQAVWSNEFGMVASVEEFFRVQLFAQKIVGELNLTRDAIINNSYREAREKIPYLSDRKRIAEKKAKEIQREHSFRSFDDVILNNIPGFGALSPILSSIRP